MDKLLRQKWFPIGACIIVFLFGGLFQPGEWYESLNKAPWNPPNWLFPIAWTFLYGCIAYVGYRLIESSEHHLYGIWLIQLVLNGLWSWLFFGKQWTVVALIDLLLLLSLVGLMIIGLFNRNKTIEGILMIPYALWLVLAVSLNIFIVVAN